MKDETDLNVSLLAGVLTDGLYAHQLARAKVAACGAELKRKIIIYSTGNRRCPWTPVFVLVCLLAYVHRMVTYRINNKSFLITYIE